MDNIDSAISKLQSMLSTEEGKKDLEGMINSFTGGEQKSENFSIPNINGIDMGSMMKVKKVIDTLQNNNDPRSQLLLSLKPYLSPARGARLDTAIRILNIGKLPVLIKNIKI